MPDLKVKISKMTESHRETYWVVFERTDENPYEAEVDQNDVMLRFAHKY